MCKLRVKKANINDHDGFWDVEITGKCNKEVRYGIQEMGLSILIIRLGLNWLGSGLRPVRKKSTLMFVPILLIWLASKMVRQVYIVKKNLSRHDYVKNIFS